MTIRCHEQKKAGAPPDTHRRVAGVFYLHYTRESFILGACRNTSLVTVSPYLSVAIRPMINDLQELPGVLRQPPRLCFKHSQQSLDFDDATEIITTTQDFCQECCKPLFEATLS